MDRAHRRGNPRQDRRRRREDAPVLQPIGFLCDHVEILFDVDSLFRDYAAESGIRLERPESLNDSPTLAKAVADLAANALGTAEVRAEIG